MAARKATRAKVALMLADIPQVDIARECNVTAGSVCAVINGRSRSRKIEESISRNTGVSLEMLWPQWYAADTSAAAHEAK